MSKYIKLEDAIEQVKTEFYGGGYQEWLEISIDNLINRIANLPTIEVSEDAISRADLLKTIDDNVSQQYSDTYETYGLDLWALFVRIVKDAPSVVPSCQKNRQVERAEGDWVGEADGYWNGELIYDVWYCPFCDYRIEEDEQEQLPNFCPNCGAKMKG